MIHPLVVLRDPATLYTIKLLPSRLFGRWSLDGQDSDSILCDLYTNRAPSLGFGQSDAG